MTTFKYVLTPFCTSNGVITSLGRVRLRTESGEAMRAALETAQLSSVLSIKRTTHQRQAIHDASIVIDDTFLCADWTDPEKIYDVVRDLQKKAQPTLKIEKSTAYEHGELDEEAYVQVKSYQSFSEDYRNTREPPSAVAGEQVLSLSLRLQAGEAMRYGG